MFLRFKFSLPDRSTALCSLHVTLLGDLPLLLALLLLPEVYTGLRNIKYVDSLRLKCAGFMTDGKAGTLSKELGIKRQSEKEADMQHLQKLKTRPRRYG